jgi:hypothetical protein
MGGVCADLLDELSLDAASAELDALGSGASMPGAPGACGRDELEGCGHSILWHNPHGHRRCERCDCARFVKQPKRSRQAAS